MAYMQQSKGVDTNQENEKVKRVFRNATETALRLNKLQTAATPLKELFCTEAIYLRDKLKDYCARLILYSPLEYGRRAEDLLWRKVFYEAIQLMRHNKKTQRLNKELDRQLRCHLSSAIGFYQNLLMRLQRDFSLDFRTIVDSSPAPSDADHSTVGYHGGVKVQQWIIQCCHRILICLGDISRYQIPYEGDTMFRISERYYRQASLIFHENGMPYNQLGTLYGTVNNNLNACYHYMRCMQSEHSFHGSEKNLQTLLKKVVSKYMDNYGSRSLEDLATTSTNSVVEDPSNTTTTTITTTSTTTSTANSTTTTASCSTTTSSTTMTTGSSTTTPTAGDRSNLVGSLSSSTMTSITTGTEAGVADGGAVEGDGGGPGIAKEISLPTEEHKFPDTMRINAYIASIPKNKLTKNFIVHFLYQLYLFMSPAENTTPEHVQSVCSDTLKLLDEAIYAEMNGLKSPAIFKIMSICLMAVHSLRIKESPLVSIAVAFSIASFTHVTSFTSRRLQRRCRHHFNTHLRRYFSGSDSSIDYENVQYQKSENSDDTVEGSDEEENNDQVKMETIDNIPTKETSKISWQPKPIDQSKSDDTDDINAKPIDQMKWPSISQNQSDPSAPQPPQLPQVPQPSPPPPAFDNLWPKPSKTEEPPISLAKDCGVTDSRLSLDSDRPLQPIPNGDQLVFITPRDTRGSVITPTPAPIPPETIVNLQPVASAVQPSQTSTRAQTSSAGDARIPVAPPLPDSQTKVFRVANRDVDKDLLRTLATPATFHNRGKVLRQSRPSRECRLLTRKCRLDNDTSCTPFRQDCQPPVVDLKAGRGVWHLVDYFEREEEEEVVGGGDPTATTTDQGGQVVVVVGVSGAMVVNNDIAAVVHSNSDAKVGRPSGQPRKSSPNNPSAHRETITSVTSSTRERKLKAKTRRQAYSRESTFVETCSDSSSSSLDNSDSCRYDTTETSSSDGDTDDTDDLMISQELKHGFAARCSMESHEQTTDARMHIPQEVSSFLSGFNKITVPPGFEMTSTMRDVAELDERMRLFRIETDTSDATSNADSDVGETYVERRLEASTSSAQTPASAMPVAGQSKPGFTYAKGTNLTKGEGVDFAQWAEARARKDREIARVEQERRRVESISAARQLAKHNKKKYGANFVTTTNNRNATTTQNWQNPEPVFCSKWVSEGRTSNEMLQDNPSGLEALSQQVSVENIKFYNNSFITNENIKNYLLILSKEAFLPTIKAFSDWMSLNMSLINMCANSANDLWSNLSMLLNMLPTESQILDYSQELKRDNSFFRYGLDKACRQNNFITSNEISHALDEDIHLRDLPALAAAHRCLDFSCCRNNAYQQGRHVLSSLDQMIVRVLALRRFGYLLSQQKKIPIIFDHKDKQFSGPLDTASAYTMRAYREAKSELQPKPKLHRPVQPSSMTSLDDEFKSYLKKTSFLIIDSRAILVGLHLIKRIFTMGNHILCIPFGSIDALDKNKHLSMVRHTIRWLENALERNKTRLRTQSLDETAGTLAKCKPRTIDYEQWNQMRCQDFVKLIVDEVYENPRSHEMLHQHELKLHGKPVPAPILYWTSVDAKQLQDIEHRLRAFIDAKEIKIYNSRVVEQWP